MSEENNRFSPHGMSLSRNFLFENAFMHATHANYSRKHQNDRKNTARGRPRTQRKVGQNVQINKHHDHRFHKIQRKESSYQSNGNGSGASNRLVSILQLQIYYLVELTYK